MPSVSGGYSAADTFSDDRIDAILQRTCQGCAFAGQVFIDVIPFLSYLPPKFTEATEKSVFLEKTENFRNFDTKGFVRTLLHVFMSSFTEVGRAEVTKWVHGIHHENRFGILPLSLKLLKRSRQKLYIGSLFPHSPSIRPVFSEIYPKMCRVPYSLQTCRLPADNK